MLSDIFIQKYNDFPVNINEVLRYAGCLGAGSDSDMSQMAWDCVKELSNSKVYSYAVSYRIVPITSISKDNDIDFNVFKIKSNDLAGMLAGCDSAVFIAATIGHGIDRVIHKYSRLNPARALFMQAIGAERVETMLDVFCEELPGNVRAIVSSEKGDLGDVTITPRFSPGYGDLSLSIQPQFLDVVDAARRIGITVNESLLMSPSKSVTAIAGIRGN